jgi:hypothetical protein
LRHKAGGVASATLSLTVPEPAGHERIELWGPAGVVTAPTLDWGDESAFYQGAVSELLAAIDTGERHACDVHFAADVVAVLAAAERFLARSHQS